MGRKPFFPASSRVLVGAALVLVVGSLTLGQSLSVKSNLETLRWYEQNRSVGDSAGYASAVYHASFAQQSYEKRWTPTGYLTLGSLGLLLGVGLIASAVRRRKTEAHDPR